MNDQMGDKLYFTGISPKGKYLTPPASLERIVNRHNLSAWEESQIQPRFPVRRQMPSNRNWLR